MNIGNGGLPQGPIDMSGIQLARLQASWETKETERLERKDLQASARVTKERQLEIKQNSDELKIDSEAIKSTADATAATLTITALAILAVGAATGAFTFGIATAVCGAIALALIAIAAVLAHVAAAKTKDAPAAELDKQAGYLGVDAQQMDNHADDAKDRVEEEDQRSKRIFENGLAMQKARRKLHEEMGI